MSRMRSIRKVVILGANGAMGSGSGAVFAAAGIPTVFLARNEWQLNRAKQDFPQLRFLQTREQAPLTPASA